jgi:hypothetical protein
MQLAEPVEAMRMIKVFKLKNFLIDTNNKLAA